MMKSKQHFLRMAVLKTMFYGSLYLFMPLAAKKHQEIVGDGYEGYVAFGAFILIVGTIIMLVRAWGLALDQDIRKNHYKS